MQSRALQGRELGESRIEPTRAIAAPTALIDQLVAMVDRRPAEELDGVGIGVPSVVEFETGRVVSSVNIPLADVPLREVLAERLGVPVFVDNDATVAALAEAHDEQLRLVAHDLVMLTVGTGVGGGLVLGGRIYRGATAAPASSGHTIIGLDLAGAVPAPMGLPAAGVARVRRLRSCAGPARAQAAGLHPRFGARPSAGGGETRAWRRRS